ncbi:NusG domain II-containing protein [Algiphilus sp.]|uniref:NusG domain II-containing protein n=1 Tax=Algiphilus sp. TaxID=1872431 RepID=UPI001CA66017|nr:NusG domain II-containing protein [Algiphilus sp.]MBY8965597.1 NusG domain II-containing protein [Algiphilus acroporae]MCI5061559.1 NusG domain II-containing protein [Algiphilus sp.]MCI5104949.1 NusG domain II-containing protein [Algiphilus sp.]MCR9091456.1 NusG domain II-containing protein [Pseudomonadota bacterium]
MTRADVVVILLLAVVVGWVAMAQWQGRSTATAVAIYRGGERIAVHDVQQRQRLTVEGRIGTAHIHIEDGRARFVQSPCQRKVCIHMGWQQYGGAVAACVPNGLSLQMLGGSTTFDGIAS